MYKTNKILVYSSDESKSLRMKMWSIGIVMCHEFYGTKLISILINFAKRGVLMQEAWLCLVLIH